MLKYYALSLILCFNFLVNAQNRTVGLVKYNSSNETGYTLFSPMNSKNTFLLDKCGKTVHKWTSNYYPGLSVSLFPDGSLLRCGTIMNTSFGLGIGGILQKFDWNGTITWQYMISDTMEALHHDAQILPNGNILAIIWERKSIAECIAKGRNPAKTNFPVWSEHIVEIKPVAKDSIDIVWEWFAWDHTIQDYDSKKSNYGVVSDHPELFDINYFTTANDGQDWFHFNSISYNPNNDQIILTSHSLSEFYIIDHSTNTVQATGHKGGNRGKGGDVLYRWGNPQAYGRGTSTDQKLFHPHHAHWIASEMQDGGSIMVFNNGWGRPDGSYSTVEVIEPNVDGLGNYTITNPASYGPINQKIVYKAPKPTSFYSQIISGAYSVPNGGLFITSGLSGKLFETNNKDSIVWEYINPIASTGTFKQGDAPSNNSVFRAEYYPLNFAGFASKTLTPISEIELNPSAKTLCEIASTNAVEINNKIRISPVPFNSYISIKNSLASKIKIYNSSGICVYENDFTESIDADFLPGGVYFIELINSEKSDFYRVIKN